jgi:rSAM/selenodomain-associated transferase 1
LIAALGQRGAADLAEAFVSDALAKARSLNSRGLVLAGTSSDRSRPRILERLARKFGARWIDQGAGSLGQRMERVLGEFRNGALLIGTDTPSLPRSLLRRSIILLSKTNVLLGPSLDGGYYLIGIRESLPDIFRAIRWGGSRVLEQTINRLRRDNTKYLIGPAWYDIDRPDDLFLLVEHLRLERTRRRADPCPATSAVLKRLGYMSGPSPEYSGVRRGSK